jgi:hypothetical protein
MAGDGAAHALARRLADFGHFLEGNTAILPAAVWSMLVAATKPTALRRLPT